jgi:hypothetical protein
MRSRPSVICSNMAFPIWFRNKNFICFKSPECRGKTLWTEGP